MKKASVRMWSRVALALTLICALFVTGTRHAAAYDCLSSGHCYAIVTWNGATHGAATDIQIDSLNSNYFDHHINYVMWLENSNATNWVEGGYKSVAGRTRFYWGDVRTSDNVYRNHDLSFIPGQYYGSGLDINIVRMPDNVSYVVALHVNSVGFSSYNYSTSNTMAASRIEIGLELAGTGGEHAEPAPFTYNQWQETNGTYHFQNQNPFPNIIGSGPAGYWAELPSNSSIGGIWVPSCGC